MHWARPHVDPMLALRNIVCSDRWDEAWPQIMQTLRQQARQQRRARDVKNAAKQPRRSAVRPPSGQSASRPVRSHRQPPAKPQPAPSQAQPPSRTRPNRGDRLPIIPGVICPSAGPASGRRSSRRTQNLEPHSACFAPLSIADKAAIICSNCGR